MSVSRSTARELAMLVCASMSGEEPAAAVLDRFFEQAHYASLASEGDQFAEYPDEKQLAYIRALVEQVALHRREVDGRIEKYARGWRTDRMSLAAAAILRCAVCEILYLPEIPAAAAINEAVDLAKKYEDADAPAFINGVLGGFVRGELGSGTE